MVQTEALLQFREKGGEKWDITGPAEPKRAQCGGLKNTCLKEALMSNSLINLNYIGLVALFIFNLQIDLGFLTAQEL